ncbi:hypothetical protein ACFQDJ_14925 [Pseudomonas brassicacearum]
MNDGLKGTTGEDLRDIGGSQLLGRGLNRLDWAGDSKECQKVGDTESGKRAVPYRKTAYNVGKNVTMSTVVATENFSTETFSSRDEFEKHTQTSVEASGKYGAFPPVSKSPSAVTSRRSKSAKPRSTVTPCGYGN